MKTVVKNYILSTNGKKLAVSLVALFRALGEEGQVTGGVVPAEVLDTLSVRLQRPGVSGAVELTANTNAENYYEVDGGVLRVSLSGLPGGVSRLKVCTKYGTNTHALLICDLKAPEVVLFLKSEEADMPLQRFPEKDGEREGVKLYAYVYAHGQQFAWLNVEDPATLSDVLTAYYAEGEEAELANAQKLTDPRLVRTAGVGIFDPAENVDLPTVDTFGSASGGGDYKTDIYMDGAGRVILERLEDGSTVILDEHENPIVKRNADGSTQYFDAYQSARLLIDASGNVSLNYTEDETVKTLQLAEAIMARTRKRLLTNKAGEETIKDEEGNILTHADIYAMLMESPDFVVLVRSDHAFHPNLVTETQIAFTCSYLGADGAFSTERVNITSGGVFSYTNGKALVRNAVGGLAIGNNCEATGANSFAEGYGCKATGAASHAEGTATIASGQGSHAEGSSSQNVTCEASGENSHAEGLACKAKANNSHAEGNGCETDYHNCHAEGLGCKAGGNASHIEGGYNEITGTAAFLAFQHVDGVYAKRIDTSGAYYHGCGTGTSNRQNALAIIGSAIYIKGIGGYDGKNEKQEGVLSLQQVFANILNPEVMALGLDDEPQERLHYSQKPIQEWTSSDLKEENDDLIAKINAMAERENGNV